MNEEQFWYEAAGADNAENTEEPDYDEDEDWDEPAPSSVACKRVYSAPMTISDWCRCVAC